MLDNSSVVQDRVLLLARGMSGTNVPNEEHKLISGRGDWNSVVDLLSEVSIFIIAL